MTDGVESGDNMIGRPGAAMRYKFLAESFRTETLKVLSVWSMFDEADLRIRPNAGDSRGRNLLEHMVHQCTSENFWFSSMLDITVTDNPLPREETRLEFIRIYAHDSGLRLIALAAKMDDWWEEETSFFDERRTRLWIMTRRLTHTAHHRGQQTALLRMLNRDLHSTYGPTADTGGLMAQHAPTIYPYPSASILLEEEASGRHKAALPGPGESPTERPKNP
jgi:uncharacterized damage-inducible protein DinB